MEELVSAVDALRMSNEKKGAFLSFDHSDVSLSAWRELARDRLGLTVDEGLLMDDFALDEEVQFSTLLLFCLCST